MSYTLTIIYKIVEIGQRLVGGWVVSFLRHCIVATLIGPVCVGCGLAAFARYAHPSMNCHRSGHIVSLPSGLYRVAHADAWVG